MKKHRKRPKPLAPATPPSATPPSATPPSATPPSATPPSATPPSAPVTPVGAVQDATPRWAQWLGMIGGIIGIVGGLVGAWSGLVSARASERSALVAEAAFQRQQEDSALTAATLQATDTVRLSVQVASTGTVQVHNISNIEAKQVELRVQSFKYSRACEAVLVGFVSPPGDPTPWKQVDILPPGESRSFEYAFPLSRPDAGPGALHPSMTSDQFGCGVGTGDAPMKFTNGIVRLTPEMRAKGATPACSEKTPCVMITYFEARALHSKLFRWAGPFDELVVQEADGSVRSSTSFGSMSGEGDVATWGFEPADRVMFTHAAEWIRKKRWDSSLKFRFEKAERAFGGLGVFRAVGLEDPSP